MVKPPIKELSVRQVKIIIVAVSVVIIFFIIWQYLYIPVRTDFNKVSSELVKVNDRITTVEIYIPRGETPQEQIVKLKADFENLLQKLPEEESGSTKMLMEFIQSLNISVASTKTGNRRIMLDDHNKQKKIDGKAVEMLLVTFELKSTYKSLIELIAILRKSIPAYMSVQRLVIEAPKGDSEYLNVTLDLNLYLLTKDGETK